MKIKCNKSDLGGYGVFATEDIKQGELIESCPVVAVPFSEWKFVQHTKLIDYIFDWAPDLEKRIAYILGYAMVYNHSYTPNAKNVKDIENGLFHFYALRDISKDEEITHNYNGNHGSTGPMWFEVKS
jgi:SET domain-containing protein